MDAKNLLLGAIAAVLASSVAGLAGLRPARTDESPGAARVASAEEVRRLPLEAGGATARCRAPLVLDRPGEPVPDAGPALAELERAAQLALTEERTDTERIEALRALWSAGSPRAAGLLATAIRTLPDASRPEAVSVPRFALSCLLQDAVGDEGARAALASVAWDPGEGASSELRSLAAAGAAAVASEREAWEVVRHLRAERDVRVREAAARALFRNPRAGTAAGAVEEWIPASSANVADAGVE